MKCPQRSHPRFSADEAKERARVRQRQNRACRRAEKVSKGALIVPTEGPWIESDHEPLGEKTPDAHFNYDKHEMTSHNDLNFTTQVRFGQDKDQDPQALHRRYLDAIRDKEYRTRRKAQQCVSTTTTNTPAIGHPVFEPAYTFQMNEAVLPLLTTPITPLDEAVIRTEWTR